MYSFVCVVYNVCMCVHVCVTVHIFVADLPLCALKVSVHFSSVYNVYTHVLSIHPALAGSWCACVTRSNVLMIQKDK